MQGVIPRFLRTPGEVRHSGGDLGQDNDAIYSKELGMSIQEIAELRADGII
jgi:crotonobetainyl-CoA:carnitine CoA-transferase CaiB-like acyl-CoA transferase